jgi:hypothetical protein
MRPLIIASCLVAAALLSNCAFDGVIVEKRFRPLPFVDSLGLDAIYNFQLRDSTGQIHSQMVTADVFASYQMGDYFNDLQLPPAHEGKEMKGFRPTPVEMNEGPYQPVRVMQLQEQPAAKRTAKIAARTHQSSKSKLKTAKAHQRSKHASKIAKSKHHTRKNTKLARKHRPHHRATVASAN